MDTKAGRAVLTGHPTKLLVTMTTMFAPRSGLTYGVHAMCPIKTGTNTVLLELELQ